MTRSVTPAVVVGTFAWRAVIAGCAFYGWWLYGHDPDELIFLTQSGNLLTALVFAVVAVQGLVVGLAWQREPSTQLLRGAMTLLLLVVASTYLGVIDGSTSEAKDAFTHVITPLLVLVDWCCVGLSQHETRWWHPLPWLVVPSVWLVWYTASDGFSDRSTWGSPIYDFMDPADSSYPGVFAGLVSATIAGAYLLYGIAKLKGAISRSVRAGAAGPAYPHQPSAHPGYPPPPPGPHPRQQVPHQAWPGAPPPPSGYPPPYQPPPPTVRR